MERGAVGESREEVDGMSLERELEKRDRLLAEKSARIRELEAQLEERTCKNNAPDYLDFLCSGCGFVHYHSDENDMDGGNGWNYCPNCGARVLRGDAE